MNPAYSVILFTCTSGAGYGLIAWISGLIMLGRLTTSDPVGAIGLLIGLVLVTIGLLTSTAHLGRPGRAWRALTQWRTSWLSREGLAAVLTYVPAGVILLAYASPDKADDVILQPAGGLTLLGSIVTVWCTGMIYASLKTIRAWCQPSVAPVYVVLALGSGTLLLLLILAFAGRPLGNLPMLGTVLLALGWFMKASDWSAIDGAPRKLTIGKATGLGTLGPVRQLDPPHTGANYVMREMGYAVARKHAAELRRFAVILAFLVPIGLLIGLRFLPAALTPALLLVATLTCAVGLLVERWLFFAEAEHVSMLYYGRQAA